MVEDVILFAVVGFVAQMIDGAIGMAYGLFTTSVLLSLSDQAADPAPVA
jgi:uncharacterized membrane protein YfcA